MAWIRTVDEGEATGLLATLYAGAAQRAGKIFNIVKVQSVNPRTLRASMGLYGETTLADSPLSRAQREMIAIVVSRANECHY